MSMTRQMGKPPKTSKQRKSMSSKSELRESWERLSTPVSRSDDQIARKLKGLNKYGSADDAKNCTFQPRCKGWKGGESKEPEEDDQPANEDVLRVFVRRQDNWTKVTRKGKEFEREKRDYELRLDRWQCRNCGTFQAYSEYLKKELRCPADICGHPQQYYQPQEVFNRDVFTKIRKLVDSAYGDEGEVDDDIVAEVNEKMKGLEPSEKCVVERYMRDVHESKMTDEQKEAKAEELKYLKQKKLDDAKAEREYKERMIKLAIEKSNNEQEAIAKAAADIHGVSLRKIYDKEEKKVIDVEYNWDQPVYKVYETTAEVTNPDNEEEVVEVPTTVKVPFYEDDDGNPIKKYWSGPQSLVDDGEAMFSKEEFFERLEDDNTKRKIKAKNNEDKNLGKIGTINKARMVKKQLEREAIINEKLSEAVEARDLMQIRRGIHEAGTLNVPLNSAELKLAIKTERDLLEEIALLKAGQEAVAKEDMDGVNTWLKQVKHRKRTKLESIKFRLRRLDRTERYINESRQDDPKFDEWVEDLSNRREQLEREREAVLASSEKNEEVGEMREKLETDKDVLDRLKNAMREKNLEMVVEVLEEAEELGLHLLPSSNARADGGFFERLERDSKKRKGRVWGTAKVIAVHANYGLAETYDIEFDDGVFQEGVKRAALYQEGDGEEGEDYDEEGENEEEEEGESEEKFALKPRKPPIKVGAVVTARRTRGPGIDIPASNQYNIFRAEDVNCAPVILRKLNRRLRAISKYLEKHPKDKKSPLMSQMFAYARQRKTIIEMCEYARVDISQAEEKKEGDSSDDDDDDFE